MTDRDREHAEAQAERERTLKERSEDVSRRPVGEEFDPDSTRQVPYLDEDGELVDPEHIDDLTPDQ